MFASPSLRHNRPDRSALHMLYARASVSTNSVAEKSEDLRTATLERPAQSLAQPR